MEPKRSSFLLIHIRRVQDENGIISLCPVCQEKLFHVWQEF